MGVRKVSRGFQMASSHSEVIFFVLITKMFLYDNSFAN